MGEGVPLSLPHPSLMAHAICSLPSQTLFTLCSFPASSYAYMILYSYLLPSLIIDLVLACALLNLLNLIFFCHIYFINPSSRFNLWFSNIDSLWQINSYFSGDARILDQDWRIEEYSWVEVEGKQRFYTASFPPLSCNLVVYSSFHYFSVMNCWTPDYFELKC